MGAEEPEGASAPTGMGSKMGRVRDSPTYRRPLHSLSPMSILPRNQQQFFRYEIKYLLRPESIADIRHYALPYLEPDPHARHLPGHRYVVQSLYLDNGDLRLFRETCEGLLRRAKLRVRFYPNANEGTCFLEIKRRQNGRVHKTRSKISQRELGVLLEDRDLSSQADHHDEDREQTDPGFQEFVFLKSTLHARPIVEIRYEREAWQGSFDPRCRLTIDDCIEARPAAGLDLPSNGSEWQRIEEGFCVLEFKFDHSCPQWMQQIVRRFELKRVSFSKYGRAIQKGMITHSAFMI